MPCTSPIKVATEKGRIHVRCKQCLQCRILKHSQLRSRMKLELLMASSAQFLTLTYEDVPEKLEYTDIQIFLRALRKENRKKGNPLPIRYFCVGEYGEQSGRGHYHLAIYNHQRFALGQSDIEQWPHGHAFTGTLTNSAANYIGRYSMKFMFEEDTENPPFAHWSLKPALGAPGMRYIVDYMANNSIPIPENFNHLQMDGESYFLDQAMLDIATERFKQYGIHYKRKPALALEVDRIEKLIIDEPFKAKLFRQEMLEEDRAKYMKLKGTL